MAHVHSLPELVTTVLIVDMNKLEALVLPLLVPVVLYQVLFQLVLPLVDVGAPVTLELLLQVNAGHMLLQVAHGLEVQGAEVTVEEPVPIMDCPDVDLASMQ